MSEIREQIKEHLDDEALFADGFDDALIGFVERCGQPTLALYDRDKCVEVLVKRDKMDEAEAWEFLEFNTFGAWMGEYTPAWATLVKETT